MLSLLTAPVRLLGATFKRLTPDRTPQTGRAAASSGPAGARAGQGRAGKYDAVLVELVGAQPGITVAQAAAVIGVDATALYPVIRRLEARGDLVKRGRELHPAEVG